MLKTDYTIVMYRDPKPKPLIAKPTFPTLMYRHSMPGAPVPICVGYCEADLRSSLATVRVPFQSSYKGGFRV